MGWQKHYVTENRDTGMGMEADFIRIKVTHWVKLNKFNTIGVVFHCYYCSMLHCCFLMRLSVTDLLIWSSISYADIRHSALIILARSFGFRRGWGSSQWAFVALGMENPRQYMQTAYQVKMQFPVLSSLSRLLTDHAQPQSERRESTRRSLWGDMRWRGVGGVAARVIGTACASRGC